MADEEKKLKSILKEDDNENNSWPASTEIPMDEDDTPSKLKMPMKSDEDEKKNNFAGSSVDDILAKVKISMLTKLLNDDQNKSSSSSEKLTDDYPVKVNVTEVKSELSKLLNDDDQKNSSSSSSEIPMILDDILEKVIMSAVKSELSKLLNDDDEKNSSSSEIPMILDDTPSKVKLIPSDGENSDANEGKPIEMDDIPLKANSEIDHEHHQLPFKTEYPRAYGYGHLLPTIESESSSEKVKLILSDGANSDVNEEIDDILLKARMAAEAKKSLPHQLTEYPRSYGYGDLSPPEPRLKPVLGVPHVFPEDDHVESSCVKMKLIPSDGANNEEKPIEMKKSEIEMPHHHQLPFKTEYPRSYGYGNLSETNAPEPRLKPVLGVAPVFPEADHVESSSEKPDDVQSTSEKADDEDDGVMFQVDDVD